MSKENVEIVRRANAAFNRRDIDALLDLSADDLQVEDLHPAPDMPPVSAGKEQVRKLVAAWLGAFTDFTMEYEEFVDVDDAHVCCVGRHVGTQRDTGVRVETRAVDLWEVRDNKLVRGTIGYPDREAALEAAAGRGAPQPSS